MFHFAATTFKIFFTSLRSHGLSLPSTTAFIDAVFRGKESLARSHMLCTTMISVSMLSKYKNMPASDRAVDQTLFQYVERKSLVKSENI